MKWIPFCLLAAMTATTLAERPERNSFIDYPIHSTQDLVEQIRTDPAVADRYERNFAMDKDQVIAYVSSLHLDRLAASGSYDVYSVPPDGHIKWHEQVLRKGVAILADASGHPQMLLKCGNPLVMRTPKPIGGGPVGPEAPLVEVPVTPSEITPPDLAMAPPPATPEDVYVPPAAAPITPAAAAFVGAGSSGSANYGWLALIPVGGLIYGLTTIHGHDHHPTPPAVPEPASFAMVGLGVTGILLAKKRKKSN